METIRPFLLEPNLLPPDRLDLLLRVSRKAAALKMPAYLVGGLVRDALLGRATNEFDVVVEGDAIKLARALAGEAGGAVTVHSRFGTASWTTDGAAIDLITARSEHYESPGALPAVNFADLDDDLRRRDFTINAIAASLEEARLGELVDPLGGRADLERKAIRVLHSRSFVEDPTRMLRAVRYSVRYGFEIVPETLALMDVESRTVLAGLSGERVRHELDLVFDEADPSPVLAKIGELALLEALHPALGALDHSLPEITAPPLEFGEFRTDDILSMRQSLGWILWLAQLSEAEVESIAARLAFPSLLAQAAAAACALRVQLPALSGVRPSETTARLDGVPALAVYAAYLASGEPVLGDYLARWRTIRPKTTGEDLKARGLAPGPIYQKILSRLRAARIDGEVLTDADEAILLQNLLSDSDF